VGAILRKGNVWAVPQAKNVGFYQIFQKKPLTTPKTAPIQVVSGAMAHHNL
jgi:hypothetical protein